MFRPPFILGMSLYVVAVVWLSIVAAKKTKGDARGFFLAGKSLSWYLVAAALISQAFGGGSTIGLAATAYQTGMVSWWKLGPLFLGILFMAIFLAKPLASMQQITHPQILEDRYGGTARIVGLFYYLAQSISSVGVQMLAFGALLSLVTGLPMLQAAAIGGVIIAVWVLIGGMLGTAWGDLFHWAIFMAGLVIMIPLAIIRAGGLGHVLAAPGLPDGYGNLFHIKPAQALAFVALVIPSAFSRQAYFQKLLSERTARDGLIGSIVAAIIMAPIYFFIPVLGMAGHELFGQINAQTIFPKLVVDVFPTGLSVLLFAALASAIMSGGGGEVLSAASNITQDIFVRYVRPDAVPKTQLLVARLSIVAALAIAFGLSVAIPNILSLLLLGYYGVVGGITFPWLAALYWPRVTTRAATASMIVGGGSSITLYLYAYWAGKNLYGVDPIFVGLGLSLVILVFGSLATRPEYNKCLDFLTRNGISGVPRPPVLSSAPVQPAAELAEA